VLLESTERWMPLVLVLRWREEMALHPLSKKKEGSSWWGKQEQV